MYATLFRKPSPMYTSAMQSVELINRLLDKPMRNASDFRSLKNNSEHLSLVLGYDIWTTEDLQPLRDAVDRYKSWAALGEQPVEDTPVAPTPPSEYPWGNRQPTLEELDAYLVYLRDVKDKEINASRLAANSSYFIYKGKKIACNALSRSDIDGANGYVMLHQSLHPQWPGGWKTMDNSFVSISNVQEWTDFYTAMYNQGLMNFAKSQSLKAATVTAKSIEEIRQIKW